LPPKPLGGRDFGGQIFDFGPDFLGIGELWSTFSGIFGEPWGRATTSPNLVRLRSKTKKLRTWVHYGPIPTECVGCAGLKPQNRSRSDNTPLQHCLYPCFICQKRWQICHNNQQSAKDLHWGSGLCLTSCWLQKSIPDSYKYWTY